MLRPATRVDVRQVMEQERAEFARLLRELTPEEAATPTICESWSVRDLAVHLLGVDFNFLSRLRDDFRNTTLDSISDWDSFVKELDAFNERWVRAGSFLSLRLIAELLETTGAMVSECLANGEPSSPGEVVSWAGPDPAPWWLVAAREFTERWVHHQQIRDALGRPGLNGPSFVGPILATAMHGVPRAYRELDAPEDTTIAIDVTGRAGFSWAVRRDAEGWRLYEGLTREAETRLALDQETARRFLMGMMDSAEARTKVSIKGDASYAEPFFDAVSAIVRRT